MPASDRKKLLAIIVFALPAAAAAQVPLDTRITGQIMPGQGLTADEAARRARATSFELAADKEDAAAAHASIDEAKAGYVPKLQGIGRYTRLSHLDPPDLDGLPISFETLDNSYELSLQLTVPVSDYFLRVAPSVDAAKAAASAADLSAGATARQVESDARVTYYQWVRARLSTTVAEEALDTSKAHLDDVRKLQNVGTASRADVLRVESSVAQAELSLIRARNSAELAEAQLRTAIHDPGPGRLEIGEDVLADLSPAGDGYDALATRAIGRREELAAIDRNRESVQKNAEVTRAGYLPRLDLVGSATYANPNSRVFPQHDAWDGTWQVGAQLTWTFSDIVSTSAKLSKARAQTASLAAQHAATVDGIKLQVLSAWQAVKEARAAIATTTTTLGTAEEAYRVRRALFQAGRATSLELTDAELDLTRARLDAIDARIDLRVAGAQLDRAVAGM